MNNGETNHNGAALELVCFRLGDETYALNAANVAEIVAAEALSLKPQFPSFVFGLTSTGRRSVAFLDLKQCFGLPYTPLTAEAKIVVLSVRCAVFGLLVDEVLENMRPLQAYALPPSKEKLAQTKNCALGLVREAVRVAILLDSQRLAALLDGMINKL